MYSRLLICLYYCRKYWPGYDCMQFWDSRYSLWVTGWKVRGTYPIWGKYVSLLQNLQTGCGAHSTSC